MDQWDVINSGKPSQRSVLLHNIDPLFKRSGEPLYPDTWDTSVRAAIRLGSYKLITGDPGPGLWVPPPESAANQEPGDDYGSLEFIPEREPSKPIKNVWLFNITADPAEHHDLSEEHPLVVKVMLDMLTRFNATAVPARYPPNDPKSNPALHGGVWGPWE